VPSGLDLSRSRPHPIPLHVAEIARRVEHLRGLRFKRLPRVRVVSAGQLGPIGHRLRAQAAHRLTIHPSLARRERRLARAQLGLQRLAGLFPLPAATEASGGRASAEQIGGAYDYSRHAILLVNGAMATRRQLHVVLAHELVHALEDQHFDLRLTTVRGPSESQQARRALIEGTATFVAARYDHRYQRNNEPVRLAISSQQSVFTAGGETPYAVKASTIFDYVSGPLFAADLYRRAHGSWRLVDRALRDPPEFSHEILEPASWPGRRQPPTIHLFGARPAGRRWHLVGGGMAGQEMLLSLLGAGAPTRYAEQAAAGWEGGRFAVWRRPADGCAIGCQTDTSGVMAVRLRDHAAVARVARAYFAYALLGLVGERIGERTWRIGDGYVALGTSQRSAAIAFTPSKRRARLLALTAALDAGPLARRKAPSVH
jgi:hypothetical protein